MGRRTSCRQSWACLDRLRPMLLHAVAAADAVLLSNGVKQQNVSSGGIYNIQAITAINEGYCQFIRRALVDVGICMNPTHSTVNITSLISHINILEFHQQYMPYSTILLKPYYLHVSRNPLGDPDS